MNRVGVLSAFLLLTTAACVHHRATGKGTLLAVAETVDLAVMADGVILVIRPGTPFAELEAARDQLKLSGAKLLGYVYNRAAPATSGFGYGGLAYGHIKAEPSSGEGGAKRPGTLSDATPDSVP